MKSTAFAKTLLIAATAAMLASSPLQAQKSGHYRWVDDNGKPQYSDRPPVGRESEFIEFAGGKRSRSAIDSQEGSVEGRVESEAEKLPGVDGEMEVVQKDPELCKQAQGNLKSLSGTPRVRITEPDGSKRILTPDEIQAQRDRAQSFIDIHC